MENAYSNVGEINGPFSVLPQNLPWAGAQLIKHTDKLRCSLSTRRTLAWHCHAFCRNEWTQAILALDWTLGTPVLVSLPQSCHAVKLSTEPTA